MRWRHIVVGTRCSWLHGDRRGFRSRDHRIHSSGDYKNPPPPGEHAGLHRYHDNRSGDPIDLDLAARVMICRAFVQKWRSMGYRIIACTVAGRHLHAIVEGPANYAELTKLVGRAKQAASHAVRDRLPGQIWSAHGGFKPIRSRGHFRNSYKYVRTRQEAGAVVWSHNPAENWIDDPQIDIVVMRGRRDAMCLPQAGV